MLKQALLTLPRVMSIGEVQADEAGVHVLASDQRYEVRSIVRHQHPIVADRVLHVLPILGSLPTNPCNMSTLESNVPCDLCEVGTQTLVDQELHKDGGRSSSEVSLDERGC